MILLFGHRPDSCGQAHSCELYILAWRCRPRSLPVHGGKGPLSHTRAFLTQPSPFHLNTVVGELFCLLPAPPATACHPAGLAGGSPDQAFTCASTHASVAGWVRPSCVPRRQSPLCVRLFANLARELSWPMAGGAPLRPFALGNIVQCWQGLDCLVAFALHDARL